MRRAVAHLPLHSGRAPRWLFERMKRLGAAITLAICEEFGPEEFLERLSSPFYFQSLGCVLGFDWHSSGVTTTVCGALKEGLRPYFRSIGLYIAGGKGATSRKTPQEVEAACEEIALDARPLVYASRMSAKVDSAALQDGYQIYHHTFFFTRRGLWAVVQQGMNVSTHYARRYHWFSEKTRAFVVEPHAAVACDARGDVLNMVAKESEEARIATVEAAHERPEKLIREISRMQTLRLPRHHEVALSEINPKHLHKVLLSTYERQPEDFEKLLGIKGVGPKTIRSLALISEIVYGAPASHRDPALFSFAHGGKDGHPYPVNRRIYDRSIEVLEKALRRARLGRSEKLRAFKSLRRFLSTGRETRGPEASES